MKTTWTIATTQPSPSMNQDTIQFEGTYVEAVEAARASWRETRRHTTVSAGTVAINPYHMIRRDGTFTDRNTNSGIPAEGKVEELDPKTPEPSETAPSGEAAAAALADRIAGQLGAAEGSSERTQAARIIADELGDVLRFVETCYAASITKGGTDESIFEEVTRREAGKLLRKLAPVSVPGRDLNTMVHVLEGSAPWAIAHLHNRDLWAERQKNPTADLLNAHGPLYRALVKLAEERRRVKEGRDLDSKTIEREARKLADERDLLWDRLIPARKKELRREATARLLG